MKIRIDTEKIGSNITTNNIGDLKITSGDIIENNSSVSVGGDVTGSSIVTGNENTTTVITNYNKADMPTPESVNVSEEISAIRQILSEIEVTNKDRKKIDNAIVEAQEEADDKQPNPDEIGSALDRALTCAKKAEGYKEKIDVLKPHVQRLSAWLGEHWYKLLEIVG